MKQEEKTTAIKKKSIKDMSFDEVMRRIVRVEPEKTTKRKKDSHTIEVVLPKVKKKKGKS